jgi:anti-sigma factor RsiW
MSCEKCLQNIYLYDELSPEAREVIDEHVRSCAECRTLLEDVQQQSVWVKHASQARPEPAHPRQLTDVILVRIERRTPRATVVMRLLAPLDLLFVRYALAAVSVGLLVLFVSEQQYAPVVVTPTVQPAVSATLNTDAFLQQYAREKERPKSATPSWYQCLRDESCVASLLETRKQRKLSSL